MLSIFPHSFAIIIMKCVDSNGSIINTDDIITYKYGDNRTISAPEIEGYELVSDNNIRITAESDQAVSFIYQPDGSKTKTVTATVKYRFNSNIDDTKTLYLTETMQVLQPNTFNTDEWQKTFRGWKYSSAQINGSLMESLPATVENGTEVIFDYVTDEDDLKHLSATVSYSLQGEIKKDDTFTLKSSIHYLKDSVLKMDSVPARTYI